MVFSDHLHEMMHVQEQLENVEKIDHQATLDKLGIKKVAVMYARGDHNHRYLLESDQCK